MSRKERTRVVRLDGKPINLVRRRGHLMVCAKGCCCGRTDRGYAAVPVDFYKQEYKRRKIRNKVQLSMCGCLGPCPLANVVLLFFDGRPQWFQGIDREPQIVALFDYVERLLASNEALPLPPELDEYAFNYYTWTNARAALPAPVDGRTAAAGGILFLTHADTDLLTLQRALKKEDAARLHRAASSFLPEGFPPVRAVSLGKVTTSDHMQALLNEHGPTAKVLVLRVLGGIASVPGFRRLADLARARNQHLLIVSGTGTLDPEFAAASTVAPSLVQEAAAYLQAGGTTNLVHLLRFLADHLLLTGFGYHPPVEQPQHGIYHPDLPAGATLTDWLAQRDQEKPAIGILFYRSHWMSGNLAFVDALVRELERRGAEALPVFTSSLKESVTGDRPTGQWPAAFDWLWHEGQPVVDVLISTIAFAMGDVNPDGPTPSGWSVEAFQALDVPVLQAICASTRRWQWEASTRGLNPLDTAMNVALPEFDGRIIGVPISFKEPLAPAGKHDSLEAIHYVPALDRVTRVAGLALRYSRLRRQSNAQKRIAFILTNSPGKAAKIGNAVGLDAPASLIRVLHALRDAGYLVTDIPADGDALIHTLIDRCSYDETILTTEQLAQAAGRVPVRDYETWFDQLPELQRRQMSSQWGPPPGEAFVQDGHLSLAGLELGNVFIALQPPRGYGMDPNAIYHRPDLPPTHHYYALYRWLRDDWGADAIVHLGKHGTLEWLPGKGVGLSAECYPDTFLDDLPLFYPFILNDPGEGAQAKRRGHAVIIDHLTPPLTTADAHGELAELMQLVDEYYQVELLDPAKMPLLQQQIWELIRRANLHEDLKFLMRQNHGDHVHEWEDALTADGTPVSLAQMRGRDVSHLVEELDGYLCELAGAQIRDGLHILGQVPEGEQLVELLQALTRIPNLEIPGLQGALAGAFGLELDQLLGDRGARSNALPAALEHLAGRPLVTNADILETLNELANHLLALLERRGFESGAVDLVLRQVLGPVASAELRSVLGFVCERLVPALRQTTAEVDNLLAALEGRYVPAGPSGAPTRGMAHVLPTGRNFYAVDPRALPSPAAWQIGQELARELLERYRADTGAYPETVGISVWGTSAMRTHGDDVAEVLALLGVRPVWQRENRRLVGVEVIPLEELGRPRIDVTVRISGFFRDAFPHLIRLLDEAVDQVVKRSEPPEQNYVRKHYLADLLSGLPDAERRARYRIFGSKPGSYGAGLLPLIEERNWHNDADLAEAYVAWGGYAYTSEECGVDARETFRHRLAGVQVAVHNQDNREHDVFDSDDYFQFHGGMIAAIRSLTGCQPRHYFGDTHDPARPAVRDLKEEVLRVFRTRVINPKWLEGITRHGYKGGLELAATVDYLFGYDATADVVDDWMYERVTREYALSPAMREFLERSNPWALHAMTERLLEAAQRGLWESPSAETLAALQRTHLESETLLEARSERIRS